MNVNTIEPDVLQRTCLSCVFPGECFRMENSIDIYIMTNYDHIDEKYIVVNLSTGYRIDFTPSEARAIWVTHMRVDATAEPYLNITQE